MHVPSGIAVTSTEPSEVERLTAVLRRLASVEAFTEGPVIQAEAELWARIQFAQDAIAPCPQLDPALQAVVREVLAEQEAANRLINR